MSKEKKGYIYILKNSSFPHYVKIGYAKDLKQRISTLNTAVPEDYTIYAALETFQQNADLNVHSIIDHLNPELRHNNKEFFKMTPEQAAFVLKQISIISKNNRFLDQDEVENLCKKKKKRAIKRFDFRKYGIKVGEELILKEKNESAFKRMETEPRYFIVQEDDGILPVKDYGTLKKDNKESYSLSKVVRQLRGIKDPRGTSYFLYKGESLKELKDRIDAMESNAEAESNTLLDVLIVDE